MTIHNPHNIVYYETVETECPECGFKGTNRELRKKGKLALLETTQYFMAVTELRLLRRTRDLFNRHPTSRHAYVVEKLNLKVDSEPDPELEEELADDHELQEYLESGFNLPARLSACEKREPKGPPRAADRDDIACPDCSHFLILPEQFYDMIGVQLPPDKRT